MAEALKRRFASRRDAQMTSTPSVSVVMPSFNQAAFLPMALESLIAQQLADWECIVVVDGATDATRQTLAAYRGDPRIRVIDYQENRGLGAALNIGLDEARGELIAYLPSDDVWYAGHLEALCEALRADAAAVLAVAGIQHHYNKHATGQIAGEPLQLVQVMHRKTERRWTERAELTTDDLALMFWDKLGGPRVETGRVTCRWTDHPDQRHKIIRAPNGINPYRQRYGVRAPLRFRSTTGLDVDEVARFDRYRRAAMPAGARDQLKILLVGELAYNPERILALAERGHRLYGLWTDTPTWFNWVGPLPFGHVEDLPRDDWEAALGRVQPDVIYALLNWQAVPFAHHVMQRAGHIPFVWHFKEGPFICIEKGSWPLLIDLYRNADGRLYSSAEMADWFVLNDRRLDDDTPTMILDGDLPKRDVLREDRTERLSTIDGEIHTVVPGRPIGLHPETVAELAAEAIHLHFYGEFVQDLWRGWIDRTKALAGRFLHLHPTVHQEQWVEELSRYDAGWLHFFRSQNGGDLRRADWDDLNLPARMATLAVCGLPMLQRSNAGHIVATQSIARDEGLGLFFDDMQDLGRQLRDRAQLNVLRDHVWASRARFTFDYHADRLVDFFRVVIARSAKSQLRIAR